MGRFQDNYFIVYTDQENDLLPEFHLPTSSTALVEITNDIKSLLSKVDIRRPDALFIIQNSTTSGMTSRLRKATTLDDIPIFTFHSCVDLEKIVTHYITSKS